MAMGKAGTKRCAVVSAAAGTLVLAAAVAGCQEQNPTGQTETVSTAGAAAVVVAAQASNCPSAAPKALTSNVAGLGAKLQPVDATRVLLCVYAEPGTAVSVQPGDSEESAAPASSGTPSSATITDATTIGTLSDALNALTPPPTRPVNCPNDTGSEVLGIFTNGQQEVEVLITTSGCPEASNGQKTGWVGASDFGGILAAVLKG